MTPTALPASGHQAQRVRRGQPDDRPNGALPFTPMGPSRMVASGEPVTPPRPSPDAVGAPTTLAAVLDALAAQEAVTIVQIGAYTGDSPNDPLFGFLRRLASRPPTDLVRSTVVLVEPVAEYHRRLNDCYADLPCARFERVAIAETAGWRDFYRLAADPAAHGHPEWLSQLGSLRSDRMTRLWDNYEARDDLKEFFFAHRIVERVPCITFADLLARHTLEALDLLQIDTEGYDYRILRTVDFRRVRPRFINYERVLLQEDEPACRDMLERAGYTLADWGQDTLAVRRD
jgi:FkbM family methyltransferase